MLFGGYGTHRFAKQTSPDFEKGKSFPFLKKFLRQSQLSTSESEPKMVKLRPNMKKTYPFPFG